jgi:hypothetical protein
MIDFSLITSAIEKILNEHTNGYIIERNSRRNTDPNIAATGNGWIGIRKDTIEYSAHTTGRSPWLVQIEPLVEVQYASLNSISEAEDKIENSINEILGILNDHLTLDGVVSYINGFRIRYEINQEVDAYFYAGIITIRAEARA